MEREPVLIGDRIRELRIRLRQSQAGLAEHVGISQPTVSELERGVIVNVDAWIVAKLSAALETTMDYLLGLTDDPSPRYGGPRLALDEAVRQVLLLRPEAREALVEFLRLVQIVDGDDAGSEHIPG